MPTIRSAYGNELTFAPYPSNGEALLFRDGGGPDRIIRAEDLASALNDIIPGFTATYRRPARILTDLSKDELIGLMRNEPAGVSYWTRSTNTITAAGERYLAARAGE